MLICPKGNWYRNRNDCWTKLTNTMGSSAAKPTQKSGNEITTNNMQMQIGLVNLSSEQWDLNRAHRIQPLLILFSIIALIVAYINGDKNARRGRQQSQIHWK